MNFLKQSDAQQLYIEDFTILTLYVDLKLANMWLKPMFRNAPSCLLSIYIIISDHMIIHPIAPTIRKKSRIS